MTEEPTQEDLSADLIRMLREALDECDKPSPDGKVVVDITEKARARLGSLENLTKGQKEGSLHLQAAGDQVAQQNYVIAKDLIKRTIGSFGGDA